MRLQRYNKFPTYANNFTQKCKIYLILLCVHYVKDLFASVLSPEALVILWLRFICTKSVKNCSSRSHSTRTSLTVQTTKYPIGYLICFPTSNALCACMRVHIPRKSLVVVALILESCEVSGSRKQPQIMSILCYATTYSTCLNK